MVLLLVFMQLTRDLFAIAKFLFTPKLEIAGKEIAACGVNHRVYEL